jgi:hypothetical protein
LLWGFRLLILLLAPACCLSGSNPGLIWLNALFVGVAEPSFGARASSLIIDLPDKFIELPLSHTQRFGLVAQDTLGGPLDALSELFNAFCCPFLDIPGLWQKVASEQLSGCLKRSINVLGACPA